MYKITIRRTIRTTIWMNVKWFGIESKKKDDDIRSKSAAQICYFCENTKILPIFFYRIYMFDCIIFIVYLYLFGLIKSASCSHLLRIISVAYLCPLFSNALNWIEGVLCHAKLSLKLRIHAGLIDITLFVT